MIMALLRRSRNEPKNRIGVHRSLFLPSGDPEGIEVIEKSNWSGLGLVIPRSLYGEERDWKPLHQGAGVYILAGNDNYSFPLLYIGEGDPVGLRLDEHFKNKSKNSVVFCCLSDKKSTTLYEFC